MFKLVYILLFAVEISAKLVKQINVYDESVEGALFNTHQIPINEQFKVEGSLWVLDLNNDFQRILVGNYSEEQIFKKIMEPAIRNYQLSNGEKDRNYSKDNHESKSYEDISDGNDKLHNLKKEISVMINKFFLTNLNDPDAYFNDEQSIKLYFKGPYTSLIITSGRKIYNYFIHPPSPLPSWFYSQENIILENENGKYLDIPDNIQRDFLPILLGMLRTYFSFPL